MGWTKSNHLTFGDQSGRLLQSCRFTSKRHSIGDFYWRLLLENFFKETVLAMHCVAKRRICFHATSMWPSDCDSQFVRQFFGKTMPVCQAVWSSFEVQSLSENLGLKSRGSISFGEPSKGALEPWSLNCRPWTSKSLPVGCLHSLGTLFWSPLTGLQALFQGRLGNRKSSSTNISTSQDSSTDSSRDSSANLELESGF